MVKRIQTDTQCHLFARSVEPRVSIPSHPEHSQKEFEDVNCNSSAGIMRIIMWITT